MQHFKWGSGRAAVVVGRLCLAGLAASYLGGPIPAWAQQETEYILGAEDMVKISVLSRPDYDREIAIDTEGKLVVPLVGEMQAAGLSPEALGRELSRQYRLVSGITEVSVTVTQYNSRSVNVVGEVRAAGRYGFRTIPDIWDVVIRAGGPTAAADLSRVQIVRREGEPRTVVADLSTAMEGKLPETLPELRPGDTINVPTLAAEGTATSGSTFQVLGAVRTQGVYRLGSATSVLEALALAGGTLPEANLSKAQLKRTNPSGTVVYKLDLEGLLLEGRSEIDVGLQEGDTVWIPVKGLGPGTVARGLVTFLPLLTSLTSLILVLGE